MVVDYFQRALAIQLVQHQTKTIGSIPLGMDLGDYRGCLDPSWNEFNETAPNYDVKAALEAKIPFWTLSRNFDCQYGFAIPNYGDYQVMAAASGGGKGEEEDWNQQHDEWNAQYPWESKISKVYWRGGLKFSRYEMMERVRNAFSPNKNGTEGTYYLDVKQTGCKNMDDGSFCSHKEPPETSMKYKAVLDIDGNSWSDRFPRLLCYNSAVIKITLEEDYEEYFMADLQPNVHYIPATLENFTEVAKHYMMKVDENTDAFLQQIVKNANAFCKERFTEERLNLDFLTILNSYVETLNQYTNPDLCKEVDDPSNHNKLSCWMQIWRKEKDSYIGPAAQDKHKGFTDLCNWPDVVPSFLEGISSSNKVWDLKTYKIPRTYDSVCPR